MEQILLFSEVCVFVIILIAFRYVYEIYQKFQNKALVLTFSGVLGIWALNSLLRIIEIINVNFDDILFRSLLGVCKAILTLMFLIYLYKAINKYL